MSKTHSLEALLRQNPKAAVHETSIREALDAVRKLRDSGVSSEGSKLAPILGGRPTIDNVPRPTNRKISRSTGKLTLRA